MESTWAWRLPSLLQGLCSLLCICLLFFTPESPRWLQFQGRSREATVALAQTHTNGVTEDPKVQCHLREIIDNLAYEKDHKPSSLRTIAMDANSRKRIFLASTVGVFCRSATTTSSAIIVSLPSLGIGVGLTLCNSSRQHA